MLFAPLLCAAVACASTPADDPAAPAAPAAPVAESAIVVVLDDVGWEDLAAVPTPTLDAMAALGRVWPHAYASTVCSPSRYQLVFGRYPSHDMIGGGLVSSGSDPNHVGAPVTTTSIASVLRAQGIRTAAFGKWHLNNKLGGAVGESARRHGFEAWRAGLLANLIDGQDHYDWNRFDDGVKSFETTYTTLAIESALEDWWTTTPGRKFAYVAFAAAHAPHQAAPAELLPPGWFVGGFPRQQYESAVIGLDTALARLAGYVDFATTTVIVVCDNGTPPDVPPPGALFKGYKLSQYEGGIRVPLYAVGAGIAPGVDPSLVQVVDVPRTVCDLLGVEPATGLEDSQSFAPAAAGAGPGPREWVFVQRFSPSGGLAPVLSKDDWAVVWSDGWKVLVDAGAAPAAFDLAADFTETTDLAGTAAATAKIAAAQVLRARVLGRAWPY